ILFLLQSLPPAPSLSNSYLKPYLAMELLPACHLSDSRCFAQQASGCGLQPELQQIKARVPPFGHRQNPRYMPYILTGEDELPGLPPMSVQRLEYLNGAMSALGLKAQGVL